MIQREVHNLIERYIAAYNRFEIDEMLAVLHPDVRFQNITGGVVDAQSTGKAEFEALARQSAKLFKSRVQKVTSIEVRDDKTIAAIDFSAVLAVDLPNGLKVGDTLTLAGKSEFAFKDGLICSIVDES